MSCNKLDVKGLDIVRSNFPPAMRDLMTKVLKDILSSEDKYIIDEKILDFKKSMKKISIYDIALPTGIKRLSKFADKRNKNGSIFTPMYKGAPVHVKAAWLYNDLLKYYKLDNYEKIKNSEKIRWVYLKSNPLEIKQLAFKGYDDPKQILDFIKEHIDYDKLFERALQKKIKMFYEALNWDLPVDKINTLERFF
jgi:DNA polymerase elongation subunit (family B)